MAGCVFVWAIALAGFFVVSASIYGGWRDRDPNGSPRYLELAAFAVAQQIDGLDYYDTVLDLTRVQTKVVAGRLYRLSFTIAGSFCKIGEIEYTREHCPPSTAEPKKFCVAVVFEKRWDNVRNLTSYNCM